MPTIVRKSFSTLLETRRDVVHTLRWQVQSTLWRPPTDVYETSENFVVRVEVAGMRDEDFEVALQNNTLLIAGFRPNTNNERRAYQQMEIGFGRFEIMVDVLVPVHVEAATAEYKDGFLTITLPKSKPKQIRVDN